MASSSRIWLDRTHATSPEPIHWPVWSPTGHTQPVQSRFTGPSDRWLDTRNQSRADSLARKSILVHFSLKFSHLVASYLLIYLRINWPQCLHFSTNVFCLFHVHESWYKCNVSMKILVILLVRHSAGPVPMPVCLLVDCPVWTEGWVGLGVM